MIKTPTKSWVWQVCTACYHWMQHLGSCCVICVLLLLPPPEHGFIGYSSWLLGSNSLPDYSPGENFFTVFGVFFPAATGELHRLSSTVGTFLALLLLLVFCVALQMCLWMWKYGFRSVHVFVCAGVMAGFNMSSDLQRPEHNIPVGTLAAVFTSYDDASSHTHTEKMRKNVVGQL